MAVCGVIVACAAIYALSVFVGRVVWDMSHKGEDGGGGGVGGGPAEGYGMLNWLDFLYFLSYVKASVSQTRVGTSYVVRVCVASRLASGDQKKGPIMLLTCFRKIFKKVEGLS